MCAGASINVAPTETEATDPSRAGAAGYLPHMGAGN